MSEGSSDIERAASELAARLPDALGPLARLAYNYRWSWLPGGAELFASIDPERWELCLHNPVRLLQEAPREALRVAAADAALVDRAARAEALVRSELDGRAASDVAQGQAPVAFFCAEYGIHRSLPVYSGGLGALAGDFVKEASDLALPFVAVGLMYRQGYFRQRIDGGGWQHEYWVDTDPQRLPAALVTDAGGEVMPVAVPIGGRDVAAQVWRVDVGRVPLFLLDVDRPENDRRVRWISSRLYVGDEETRLAQYALLGIGGVRALRALGIEPATIHMNEGHAALAPLELAREDLERGTPLDEALEQARSRTIFTTHTPVPAGNDSYPAEQVRATIPALADGLAAGGCDLLALARTNPDDAAEPFGVTQLALRMSRAANGVSRRHGQVARAMWHDLWPERPEEDVPIGHVTNGVHVPTWVGPSIRELLDRHLGGGWQDRAGDPQTWAAVDEIPASELWEVRCRQRAELIDFLRDRSVADRLARDDLPDYVGAARGALSPDVLTIGFARRIATYKRLALLAQDPDRTLALFAGERPVQVVLAGKAHPRDEEAKHALQSLFRLKGAASVGERVVFLDDYDLGSGAALVRGCDVWLNVPRPPLEASGTSGMKSVMNGGLQLSVLDGWWAEAYDGHNGWALSGEVDADHGAADARAATDLYDTLESKLVPAFYERGEDGLPGLWIERMRASLKTLGPRFCATRMVREYVGAAYSPTLSR
ncbi:MAG: alpha-glucan family phosphorylase [Thermoleophilaceae bacterium]